MIYKTFRNHLCHVTMHLELPSEGDTPAWVINLGKFVKSATDSYGMEDRSVVDYHQADGKLIVIINYTMLVPRLIYPYRDDEPVGHKNDVEMYNVGYLISIYETVLEAIWAKTQAFERESIKKYMRRIHNAFLDGHIDEWFNYRKHTTNQVIKWDYATPRKVFCRISVNKIPLVKK